MFKRSLRTITIILTVMLSSSIAYAVPFTLNNADESQNFSNFAVQSEVESFNTAASTGYEYSFDMGQNMNADRIDTNWGFFNPPRWLPPWIGRLPWWPIFPWRPPSGGGDNPASVPEPATMLLLGTGLIALAAIGRNRLRR